MKGRCDVRSVPCRSVTVLLCALTTLLAGCVSPISYKGDPEISALTSNMTKAEAIEILSAEFNWHEANYPACRARNVAGDKYILWVMDCVTNLDDTKFTKEAALDLYEKNAEVSTFGLVRGGTSARRYTVRMRDCMHVTVTHYGSKPRIQVTRLPGMKEGTFCILLPRTRLMCSPGNRNKALAALLVLYPEAITQ